MSHCSPLFNLFCVTHMYKTTSCFVLGRLYALQMGLKIDRKSDEAKVLLTALMDWLETQKKVLADNEAISHEIAAQAHLENYALKLFLYADSQDRASNFGK